MTRKTGGSFTLDFDIWEWVTEETEKGEASAFINKILRKEYEIVKNPTVLSLMNQYDKIGASVERLQSQQSELEKNVLIAIGKEKKMLAKQKEAEEKKILEARKNRIAKETAKIKMVGELKGIDDINHDMPIHEQVEILRSKNPDSTIDMSALKLYYADKKVKE